MIQHIKRKNYLIIYLIIGCKENRDSEIIKPIISKIENSDISRQYNWSFFNWFSIGDIKLNDNKFQEIGNKYKNIELNLSNDSIYFKSKPKEAIYSGYISSKKFFMRDYTYEFYQNFLKKEFNLTLKDSLFYFENKNKHHKESILKNYFNEGFIIKDYLFAINELDGVVIVFKDKKQEDFNDEILSSYSIKNNIKLPYDKIIDINTVKYDILKCNIKGASDWLCSEENLRFIPLFENNNVSTILVPMDCADFNYRYYLLTIKNNNIKASLYVEGEWYDPENVNDLETTSFEINKDYIIKVKTENINGDVGVNQVKNYKITEEGGIKEIK